MIINNKYIPLLHTIPKTVEQKNKKNSDVVYRCLKYCTSIDTERERKSRMCVCTRVFWVVGEQGKRERKR